MVKTQNLQSNSILQGLAGIFWTLGGHFLPAGSGCEKPWVMELDEGLNGQQGVMVVHRESASFMMEQVNLCGLCATSGNLESRVLDGLKFLDVGDGCSGSPDWGGVVYDGADDGVVGEGDGGFVLSPCPADEGFEDV